MHNEGSDKARLNEIVEAGCHLSPFKPAMTGHLRVSNLCTSNRIPPGIPVPLVCNFPAPSRQAIFTK